MVINLLRCLMLIAATLSDIAVLLLFFVVGVPLLIQAKWPVQTSQGAKEGQEQCQEGQEASQWHSMSLNMHI